MTLTPASKHLSLSNNELFQDGRSSKYLEILDDFLEDNKLSKVIFHPG